MLFLAFCNDYACFSVNTLSGSDNIECYCFFKDVEYLWVVNLDKRK